MQSFFRCLHFAHFVFLTKLLCVLWLELDQWCQQQRKFQWTWSKVLRIFVANSQTWKGEMMWRRGLGYTLYILHILICIFWFAIYSIYSTSWIYLHISPNVIVITKTMTLFSIKFRRHVKFVLKHEGINFPLRCSYKIHLIRWSIRTSLSN